jgi:hypothetical protein
VRGNDESEAIGMAEVPSVQRDIGRLEARADSTDERLERIEKKLDEVLERTTFARGGLRMLIGVGTFGASVGATIAEFLHWWQK